MNQRLASRYDTVNSKSSPSLQISSIQQNLLALSLPSLMLMTVVRVLCYHSPDAKASGEEATWPLRFAPFLRCVDALEGVCSTSRKELAPKRVQRSKLQL